LKRGELYLVRKPGAHDTRKEDPRKQRVFVIASRPALISSRHSSVICAPVYSTYDALSTQVLVGPDEGLKKESCIHCDDLMSLPKSLLTHYLGSLSPKGIREFDQALKIALGLERDFF
jgi:mRNA interferase MazF